MLGELEERRPLLAPMLHLRGGGPAAHAQRKGDVLEHGEVRVEGVVLEHHREVAVARGHVVHAPPADQHVAGGDVLEAGDHPEQRRLPAPRRPDEDHQLAVGDVEAHVVHHRLAAAVALDDVPERDLGHHPFTAPAVRPATMRRWKSSTRTTTGIVTTTEAAAIAGTGDWYCDAPVKKASAAGTVRERSVEVSAIANRKSFQQKKKVRMAVVNTPGAARGTITLRNACQGVAPSTCAACSSSHGIWRKKAAIVQMASGRANVREGMTRPGQVPYSPVPRHRANSGLIRAAWGNIAIPSATTSSRRRPGKSSRATA